MYPNLFNSIMSVKIERGGILATYFAGSREKFEGIKRLRLVSEGSAEAVVDYIEVEHSRGSRKIPLSLFENYPDVKAIVHELEIKTGKKVGRG